MRIYGRNMKIVFRVDGSVFIGSGHIMRCLVLAKQLRAYGHEITFASKSHSGNFHNRISQQGFSIIKLNKSDREIKPSSSRDYQAWLQGSWENDAKEFILKIKSANLVIVDHYALDINWERKIFNRFNCKILAIDDLVREHYADLVVDQTYGRNADEYILNKPNSKILAGSKFALISSDFRKFHTKRVKLHFKSGYINILVSMGGIDYPNITLQVLEILSQLKDEYNVSVLLGKKSPHFKKIKDFCFNRINFTHIPFTNEMAKLMKNQHIAIGAPGHTTWERASIGLPSILIPIADNQKDIVKNLSKTGAVCVLNSSEISVSLHDKINLILKNWHAFSEANLDICDGYGLSRVSHHINNILERN